jgi:hypothetical protein
MPWRGARRQTDLVSTGDGLSEESMDWNAWHRSYDDAESPLSRRLAAVRARIGEALEISATRGTVRILSLCAGDGRDVLPELAARPSLPTATTLVERDDRLAASARQRASLLDSVHVRQGDAGDTATFADVLPVDLLLLCGIFGNISRADISATIAAVPSMVAQGGTVIWTRGWFPDEDLRPTIRRWFVEAGLTEVSFDGDPERFGVGVARITSYKPSQFSAARLFHFIR